MKRLSFSLVLVLSLFLSKIASADDQKINCEKVLLLSGAVGTGCVYDGKVTFDFDIPETTSPDKAYVNVLTSVAKVGDIYDGKKDIYTLWVDQAIGSKTRATAQSKISITRGHITITTYQKKLNGKEPNLNSEDFKVASGRIVNAIFNAK